MLQQPNAVCCVVVMLGFAVCCLCVQLLSEKMNEALDGALCFDDLSEFIMEGIITKERVPKVRHATAAAAQTP